MATQTHLTTRFALVPTHEPTPAEKAVEVLDTLSAALTHHKEDPDARTASDHDES
jgi:hypothetical protein